MIEEDANGNIKVTYDCTLLGKCYFKPNPDLEVLLILPKEQTFSTGWGFMTLKGEYYTKCDNCKGYVKGEPYRHYTNDIGALCGRCGYDSFCPRCGNDFGFCRKMS